MNILFTNSKGLGYGGAEVTISQYANELKNRNHNVIIAASQRFKDIKTEKIKFVEKWPFFLRRIYLKKRFIKIIKKHSIDIITPQDHTTAVAAILAAKECSIPSVVHFRDLWFACPRSSCLKPNYSECIHCSWKKLLSCSKWYRYPLDLYKWHNHKISWKILNSADAKVCVSSTVKNKLARCRIRDNVNIVAGARVNEEFENVKGIKKFKTEHKLKEIVVTFIGSFFYTKGILQIFRFMPEILKNNPNVSLLLVGDGPLYGKVTKIIETKGIKNQVVLTGRLPFEKIPLCYNVSDILLAPHLWSEPLGATILEASAAGKPSIISDRGGTIDFKETFDNIISPKDIKLWKEKVLHLINNPSVRDKQGKKAKQLVKKLSMKSYVDKVEQIYSKLL